MNLEANGGINFIIIYKGSINLNLCCTTDSTYKNKAKALSMAGLEQESMIDSSMPTKFALLLFWVLGILEQREGK